MIKKLVMDPSLTAFGWAIVNGDEYIEGGCIKTKPSKKDADHLDIIFRGSYIAMTLKKLIEEHKPDEAEFEIPVGSKSSKALRALAMVEGIVISALTQHKIPFKAIMARNVKLALTGKRNAEKEEILEVVKQHFPIDLTLTKVELFAISDALAVHLALKGI